MKKTGWFCFSAVGSAMAGIILSFLCFVLGLCLDGIIMALSDILQIISLFPPVLSGVLFWIEEFQLYRFLVRKEILSEKQSAGALLTGALLYAPLTIIVIESSIHAHFMYALLPAREMASEYMTLFYDFSAIGAAFCCVLVHIGTLISSRYYKKFE